MVPIFSKSHLIRKDSITCIAISPDQRFLVSGSEDCSIKMFDIQTKQEIHEFAQDCIPFLFKKNELSFPNNRCDKFSCNQS